MGEIYVFGHKKPDTDTVTSSIALSYLKNKLGFKTKPMILGEINNETKFVLDYFNVPVPQYLNDVKLQIKDLNYHKNCFIHEDSSLGKAYDYMTDMNITGVPIVDKENKFEGILTSKMIGSELIYGDYTKLKTSYDNIVEILNGEEILKFDKQILGNIIVPSYRSTTFLNTLELKDDTIMIVGDRHSLIEAAVNSKIKLLIIVGNSEIKPEHIQIARVNRVNIIRTKYDTFRASKLINLSNYCKNLLTDERNISFNENDYYDYFKERSMKYGYNNYPVIDNDGVCLGLIRITDINKKNRKKVILVDHNDSEQSAEGISEAEILEIVDHHNIGALTTNMPINFRSMTVGSTNTILYSMYVENNVQIPKQIAGLMLSGIISDTLKFTSPTTTEYDRFVADRLLSISGLDIDEYAKLMFKQGTKLKGKTIEEIIEGDLKTYNVDSKKIAISQVLTFDSDEFLNKKDDYLKAIDNMKKSRDFDLFVLCVTDILKSGSYIFYDEANEQIIQDAFNIDSIFEGFFLEKCLSRKKQVVPAIMNILR